MVHEEQSWSRYAERLVVARCRSANKGHLIVYSAVQIVIAQGDCCTMSSWPTLRAGATESVVLSLKVEQYCGHKLSIGPRANFAPNGSHNNVEKRARGTCCVCHGRMGSCSQRANSHTINFRPTRNGRSYEPSARSEMKRLDAMKMKLVRRLRNVAATQGARWGLLQVG